MISLIVALTNNNVIGRLNIIPWYLPKDLLWFKSHTLNKPVIMGRRTFESIGNQPLKNRFNIILSRCFRKHISSSCMFVRKPDEALQTIKKMYTSTSIPEIMVIGGGEIYKIFLPYADRLYITSINIEIYGDTFFPYYRKNDWKIIFNECHNLCNSKYQYSFNIFERVSYNLINLTNIN